jgi:hypothetical protein
MGKLDHSQQYHNKSLSLLEPNTVSLSGHHQPRRLGLGMPEPHSHSLRLPVGHARADHARTVLHQQLHFTILLPIFTVANQSLRSRNQANTPSDTMANVVWILRSLR